MVNKNESSNRGGSREGAGRKSIGDKKVVSITLVAGGWDEIDKLIKSGKFSGYAEYFRWLHESRRSNE